MSGQRGGGGGGGGGEDVVDSFIVMMHTYVHWHHVIIRMIIRITVSELELDTTNLPLNRTSTTS